MSVYGLYDTFDDCWLGTNDAGDGPRTFEREVAVVAENVWSTRLSWPRGRLTVKVYTGDANKPKDELTPLLSLDQAYQALGWQDELTEVQP